ncbi:MAG: hypothetical protein JSV52_05020 [Candidatus Zixiibacteriota bacterium]|nr:MAG: hypothetical protein JSV52_05020 [candidate division Zixibacteria bacterium]
MDKWHFEYVLDADVENAIMYEKIYGVWRVETAENYNRDYVEEARELVKKPWAKLIDLSNWKTGSPEVIEKIGEHLEWCRKNNMIWSINIINNPVTYSQLQKMFSKGGTKNISKTFRTREEAERFLKQQGFKLRPSNGGNYR